MQTGWKPTCRQTDRLEAYPTFLGRMVADGRSSIVKKRRCCVLEDKIRDTVPSVEEAKSGRVTSCNEPYGNEESLEKPRGKSVFPENSKAFQMEAAGIEHPAKSLGKTPVGAKNVSLSGAVEIWTPKTQSWNDRRDSSQDCQQDALNASEMSSADDDQSRPCR